jgi:hypothetical protein
MALINKLTTALQKEARDLASRMGISVEKAAEDIIDREGQKAFGLTTKPTIEDFSTDPTKFLGARTDADNRSLSEILAAGEKASSAAAPVSKEQSLVPYSKGETSLVPVGKVTPRSSEEIRLPSKMTKEVEERGKATSPAFDGGAKDRSIPPRTRTEESPSEDFAAGLEDVDMNLTAKPIAPRLKKAAAITAGAAGLYQALRGDQASTEKQQPDAAVSEGIGPVASGEQYAQSLEKQSTPELKKNIKTQLAQADQVAKNPPAGATPKQVDRFKEERDRLYDMYEQAKTRNEWLEIAQLVGQAFTQYGAAQVGMKTGRPMTGLQIPTIDYGARTEREGRLLERRLRDIGEEQEREQRLADKLKAEERDAERLGLERRRVELAEREAGQVKLDPEERQIRREERVAERKEYVNKVGAFQTLIGAQQILASSDATKKQKEKARETVAEQAAKVGIDMDVVRDASPGTGLFGQKSGVDEKKVLTNFKIILDDYVKSKSAPPPALSAEDREALKWATSNPNDPRAAEIRKRLGR